ncbi:shikimate dehydrogenase [Pelagirhabdus alkalitolerans]|uniref:Shikimate dehydrogenase (NADP(+)) n=1 Tax=Pelagirhabdus alkalitolerans TaxID=1612202 RepID=A0A1G6HTF5_9BACI|nr:shikimate dehydrogenase [Pelagirhabdus alkalitolerans]SDB97521.1 shikimate dehydrogenase [Pelagirhabdus alkalitolerans]
MELGLIGYPVQGSLSPWIHHQFLDQLNMTGSYELYEIAPDQFEEQISDFKRKNLNGFNVTIPYKQRIIPYLDALSDSARAIGAVNTVVCHNGKWTGYNTDGFGLTAALEERFDDLFYKDKHALILGAGGASRGIYYSLLQAGFNTVDISNRTYEKAVELTGLNNSDTITSPMTFDEAEQKINHYDLIVQTTSVGMTPNEKAQVIDLEKIKKGAVVSDIVYKPFWTQLLKQAYQKRARVHHGHEMLLYQAKLAFEHFTGQSVDAKGILGDFEKMIKSKNEG